ncbi:MAG: DNA polymerase III subunit delta [Candidatus Magasanikbacteria bacterium]|nr:DNA polymerase III subunit delta [Candidatus Magasanikbacteria bacterium]
MILYLYGADTKRSREHLDKLIEKFYRERDPQKLNVVRVVVGGDEEMDIRSQLLTAPFLAPKRMVVIERMLELGDAELLTWFEGRFLDHEPPADTIVVVWEEEPIKKSKTTNEKLHARLVASKFAQEFATLEGKKREEFIVRAIDERGGKITSDAAAELHRRIADDHELINAIDVLVSYAAGAAITHATLEIFLPPDIENKIFDAMDLLASKKKAAAMKQLANVWFADNDPVYIFAMLHRQVRLLFQTRELLEDNAGVTDVAIAKQLGIHPFVAKKMLGQARLWTRSELVAWYDRLIEIDYAIKHGSSDPRVLIDKFVAA